MKGVVNQSVARRRRQRGAIGGNQAEHGVMARPRPQLEPDDAEHTGQEQTQQQTMVCEDPDHGDDSTHVVWHVVWLTVVATLGGRVRGRGRRRRCRQ